MPFSPSESPCDVRDSTKMQRRHSSFGDCLRPESEEAVTPRAPRTPRTPRTPQTPRTPKPASSDPISSSCETELFTPSPITPVGRTPLRRSSMLAGRQKSMRNLQGQPRKLIPVHRSLEGVLKESCSDLSQDTAPTETSQSTSSPTERLAPKRTVSARPAPLERKLSSRRASLSAPVYKQVSKEDFELLFSVVRQSKPERIPLEISKKEQEDHVNEKPLNGPDSSEQRLANGRIYVKSKHALDDILKAKEKLGKIKQKSKDHTALSSKKSSNSHSKSSRRSKDSNGKTSRQRSGAGTKEKKNHHNKSNKESLLSPKKDPASPPDHFAKSTVKTPSKKSGKHKSAPSIDEYFNFGEQKSPFRPDASVIDGDDTVFARFIGDEN